MSAKLDIIVVGATGYTGRITCKYLSTHKEKITWGIAGRSEAKLKDLKAQLGAAAAHVKTFVVDVENPETLDAVCAGARCIISCAGPFNVCGLPVVEACVRNKVHYIDSTGEFTFVRLVAERFHDEAKKNKIVLSSCCGFDCVPSDLGNYIVHRESPEPLKEVKGSFLCKTSGISSGTANSIAEIMNYMKKEDMSPVSLNPSGADIKKPLAAPMRYGLWYDGRLRSWTTPFVMAACNERIVRRSNALLGRDASYVECMQTPGLFSALAVTVGFYVMGLVMAVPPLRNFLVRRLYPTGVAHGPTDDKKKGAFFRCTFAGTTVSGKTVTTVLQSPIDMYDITGVFLVECALSALTLEKKGTLVPGVVTPAAGFGDELVRRSRDAGLNISTVVETTEGDDKKQN